MSGSPQPPDPVYPVDVHEERNLLRNIQNALGIDKDDPDWDDNALAAIIANTARLNQLMETMGVGDVEVVIDEISPQVTVDGDQFDLDVDAEAFREALEPINRVQLYDESTSGSGENVLSQPVRPMFESSSLRITITMATNTTLSLQVEPDDDPNTTQLLNTGTALVSGARYEFTTDVEPTTDYNLRTGAAASIDSLRIQELFTD